MDCRRVSITTYNYSQYETVKDFKLLAKHQRGIQRIPFSFILLVLFTIIFPSLVLVVVKNSTAGGAAS
jgi:hypothetical protein